MGDGRKLVKTKTRDIEPWIFRYNALASED